MPVGASSSESRRSSPNTDEASLHVLSRSNWFEMVRIDTSVIATQMIEVKSGRDYTSVAFIDITMGIGLDHPISTNIYCSSPDPTPIGGVLVLVNVTYKYIGNLNKRMPSVQFFRP